MAKKTGIMKPMIPSDQLMEVVGQHAVSRAEAIKKLWAYIKKHNLQDPKDRRTIIADDVLEPIFGKSKVNMMEIPGILNVHLKDK